MMEEKEKKHILIVDDSRTILKHAEGVLMGNYQITLKESGKSAYEWLLTNTPDLVLLDINMPELNGYETFKLMKENTRMGKIPVVFLTADTNQDSEVMGLEMGAMDYITKPFSPKVMQQRIARIIELNELRKNLESIVQSKTEDIQKFFIQSITTIAYAIDAKDRYTRGHSVRVAQYCVEIAKRLDWSKESQLNLYYIALLHDIGKIGIPDRILNKPGRLTDEEYRLIRNHTLIGDSILKPITLVPQICEGARHHHERYDGKGYPDGLKGSDIPYVARIVGTADTYDAITSNRIYERARVLDYAISELEKGKGTQFDPYLADIMIQIAKSGFTPNLETNVFELEHFSTAEDAEHDKFIVSVCNDAGNESKHNENCDYLTNFYTRKVFESYVNTYFKDMLNTGTMFLMDIDHFMYVNENYGHVAGDRIICILADVIRECTSEDEFVCRISSDEFAIFYRGMTEIKDIEKTARKIMDTFDQAIREIDNDHKLSLSIGICIAQKANLDCKVLLQKCDKALYFIKQNGKNNFKIYQQTEVNIASSLSKGLQMDLAHLKHRLSEEVPAQGAYRVEYGHFEKIYQLIARSLSRNNKMAQIILFSINENIRGTMDIGELNEAMNVLERCIVSSLRKGDVTTRYSSSQQVVIMIDSNLENGKRIAQRIIENYSRIYDNYNVELIYNIEEISSKQ